MNLLSNSQLLAYWSASQLEANVLILLNIVGSLFLGMILGYERAYHGRAAGVRTYGLVCMASSAMTVIAGFPHFWFGGMAPLTANTDPTRIIQGIVTGIGFLGAGVIMKEGMNISGLTTAASIWASSSIGILCGSGFYCAAIILTLVATAVMTWGGSLENLLPSRHAVSVLLRFPDDVCPLESEISALMQQLGFRLAEGSINIQRNADFREWHFVLIANSRRRISISTLAQGLESQMPSAHFQIAFARN
jgi:putative Mg2+ transporter-C (MgtC) family protein